MKIKSIYITEGMFERKVDFSDTVNLIYSKKNSRGKTTLLRFLLYGMGYTVPNTKKIKFNKCEVEMVIETDNNGVLKLSRNNVYSIQVMCNDKINTYVLPEQQNLLHQLLFSTDNMDLLNNILGAFYVDQEKGWTLLNRGVVIGSIHFNIEELLRGLSDVNCSDLVHKEKKLSVEIGKYKQMFSVAEYQNTIENDLIVSMDYQDEVETELDKLLIKKRRAMAELKRIDSTLSDNKKFKKFISDMKLLIKASSGEIIPVTEDNVVGLNDSINILITKQKNITKKVVEIEKSIEKLKKTRDREYDQISFFKSSNMIEVFDYEISKLSLNQSRINSKIDQLNHERKNIRNQISRISNSDSSIIKDIQDIVRKYMEELELGDKNSIPQTYIFTSNLKELTGAILHKTVFAFRLAYIVAIEKKLKIKLPIILDSPSGKEVDRDNVNMMMNILKRDFSDHQIIIASIYEYSFDNVNKIEIVDRLMEDMININ